MNVAEALIWREWLKLHEKEWDVLPDFWLKYRVAQGFEPPEPGDVFDYNVRVGQPRDPGPDVQPDLRRAAIMTSMMRIDAVGFQLGTPTIFEVHRRIGPAEVGQLVSYRTQWRESKVPAPAPALRLVGQAIVPNEIPVIHELGIPVDLVQVNLSVLSPLSIATG